MKEEFDLSAEAKFALISGGQKLQLAVVGEIKVDSHSLRRFIQGPPLQLVE